MWQVASTHHKQGQFYPNESRHCWHPGTKVGMALYTVSLPSVCHQQSRPKQKVYKFYTSKGKKKKQTLSVTEYVAYYQMALTPHKIVYNMENSQQYCWNNFPGPRWSHSCLGCHVSKPTPARYPASQSPNSKPALGSLVISLFLLTPDKFDCVTPANQLFCIFLFICIFL